MSMQGFFVLFFRRFFPLFRFRGRPLATYYLYLRIFDILLWMGWGIGRFCLWGESGRICIIYGLFLLFILISKCKVFWGFLWGLPKKSVMDETVLGGVHWLHQPIFYASLIFRWLLVHVRNMYFHTIWYFHGIRGISRLQCGGALEYLCKSHQLLLSTKTTSISI